jgi:hypothetical protein
MGREGSAGCRVAHPLSRPRSCPLPAPPPPRRAHAPPSQAYKRGEVALVKEAIVTEVDAHAGLAEVAMRPTNSWSVSAKDRYCGWSNVNVRGRAAEGGVRGVWAPAEAGSSLGTRSALQTAQASRRRRVSPLPPPPRPVPPLPPV